MSILWALLRNKHTIEVWFQTAVIITRHLVYFPHALFYLINQAEELQKEIELRRKVLEYRFTAFTGDQAMPGSRDHSSKSLRH